MDNFTLMLVGAGLTAGGAVALRGSTLLGVRALAAGALSLREQSCSSSPSSTPCQVQPEQLP